MTVLEFPNRYSAQPLRVPERYRLVTKLGQGGMADVFLGVQYGEQNFKRLLVIKRIHSRMLKHEEAMDMFINEARTAVQLNHPHIVQVFDLSKMDGDICISMEYVNGENLSYLRKYALKHQKPIPLPVISRWMIQACEALHYAHSAKNEEGKPLNLVHRDIGAQNLMIDRSGYLKIIDFGIAKSTIQAESTSPGLLKGKLSYMAPDVFEHDDIDGRADLYALGIVFYELVTLKQPFRFKPDVHLARAANHIIHEQLSPPSSLVRILPKQVDAVILKAIHKDREKQGSGKTFPDRSRICQIHSRDDSPYRRTGKHVRRGTMVHLNPQKAY